MLPSNAKRLLKKLGLVTLSAVALMSMLNFTTNIRTLDENHDRLVEIARYVQEFESGLEVDSARTAGLTKVIGIIDQYNDEMSRADKYAIANEIYKMSVKYENLDIDLICATITHESARTWRPDVISHAGAIGLMQIMPYTGAFLSKHEGIEWTSHEVLYNPIYNIRMGCRYLSMLIELYHIDGGLAAYNGGERRAAMWLASGRNDEVLFEETRGYIPAVLKLYDAYKN